MKKKPAIPAKPLKSYIPQNEEEVQLIKAISTLKNEEEITAFIRDLLTPAEIEEFSHRIEIAKLLLKRELSYAEVADTVGTSTTTVTRVAQWLFRGCGGYLMVLDRLKRKR